MSARKGDAPVSAFLLGHFVGALLRDEAVRVEISAHEFNPPAEAVFTLGDGRRLVMRVEDAPSDVGRAPSAAADHSPHGVSGPKA